MARVTYYVFQPFTAMPDSEIVEPAMPVQMPTLNAAMRAVAVLANGVIGGFAFSRSGDPEDGDWDDAVIIASNGIIPEECVTSTVPW